MPSLEVNRGRARVAPPPAGLPPIKGFLETSFLDWRGRIAAVLFLPGCNFRCPFCHNFALVDEPEQYQTLPFEGIMDRLRPFVGWVDGVVVTGGEPTLHAGLGTLLGAIREEGFAVKIDTNGYRPEVLEGLIGGGLVDCVSMDVKAPLNQLAYRRAAGVGVEVERLRRSVSLVKSSGLEHEFRTTVLPQWHGRDELYDLAAELSGCQRWTLQAMNPTTAWDQETMGGREVYSAEEVARLQVLVADPVCAG